jgi:hypothetical protein
MMNALLVILFCVLTIGGPLAIMLRLTDPLPPELD